MNCYITLSAWIFLCLHQAFCNSGVDLCTPKAKQGASYTISSSVDILEEFKWKTYNASGLTTRSRCFISSKGTPVCVDEDSFYHADVKALNGIYQMTLTIPTVFGLADDNVIWVWGTGSDVNFKELGRCKMEVNYPCEPPAKLGLPYSFMHTVKTMKHFRWRKQGDNGYSTASTCYQDPRTRRLICDDRYSTFHAQVKVLEDGSYSLTLNIPNVLEKRDLVSWIWEMGDPDAYEELGSCDLTLYYPCPTPAKQGSPYTFTQQVNTLTNFVWNVKNSLTHCYIDENKHATCKVESTIYDAEVEKEDIGYKLSLTINSVARPRDEGPWSWKEGLEGRLIETGRCDLEVYYHESAPTCTKISVENTGTTSDPSYSVVWSCTISKVYPTPLCLFQYKKYGTGNNDVIVASKYVTEGVPVSSRKVVYYSRECSISVPVTLLSLGYYKFKVNMYPSLVGADQDTKLSIGSSTESSSLELVLPKATLRNCPHGAYDVVREGYIRAGTSTSTCRCVLTRDNAGNPPGWIEWFDSSGNSVGHRNVIKLSKNDTSGPFTCTGFSHLGKGDDVHFTPKYASGPNSSVEIGLTINGNSGTFSYEPDTFATFPVICDVPFMEINPGVEIKLSFYSFEISRSTFIEETKNGWRRTFHLSHTGAFGNKMEIKCTAYNSIFSTLKTSKTGYIDIEEEVKDDPLLYIIFGNMLGIAAFLGAVFGIIKLVNWCNKKKKERNELNADQSSVDGNFYMWVMKETCCFKGKKKTETTSTAPEPPTTTPPKRFDFDKLDDNDTPTDDLMENTYVDLDDLPRPLEKTAPFDPYHVVTDC